MGLPKHLQTKHTKISCFGQVPRCPVCGEETNASDPELEYVRTKRKTDIFVHRTCVKDWGK